MRSGFFIQWARDARSAADFACKTACKGALAFDVAGRARSTLAGMIGHRLAKSLVGHREQRDVDVVSHINRGGDGGRPARHPLGKQIGCKSSLFAGPKRVWNYKLSEAPSDPFGFQP